MRPLGKGGEGSVYLAVNEKANKFWAVKNIPLESERTEIVHLELWKHFFHPNLPQIVDLIEEENHIWLVMDYVEGITLEKQVRQCGKVSKKQALDWMLQICDTLSYLHNQKPAIVHGDVKPANLILRPDGKIMLVDFGTLERAGTVRSVSKGTVGYASGKQHRAGNQAHISNDIYSLGMTLFYLLNGAHPLREQKEIMGSKSLKSLFSKCILASEGGGFSTCAEIRKEIYRMRRKKVVQIMAAFGIVLLLLAGLGGLQEGKNTENSAEKYDNYMDMAKKSVYEEQQAWCRQAVLLKPDRKEAYLRLISLFGEDNVLTEEEDKDLRKLLKEKNQKKSCEESLKENKLEYGKVAYEMGLLYWNCYISGGGKAYAAYWFAQALEQAQGLQEPEIRTAEIFCRLGQYYEAIYTGKNMQGLKAYWRELDNLEKEAEKDTLLQLHVWEEKLRLLFEKTEELRSQGISQETLEHFLEKVYKWKESKIQSASRGETNLKDRIMELLEPAQESFRRIYESIEEEIK